MLAAVCLAGASSQMAHAAKPVSLELKKTGDIVISSQGLPDLEMRVEVKDGSKGGWGPTRLKSQFAPDSGTVIDRVGVYEFQDSSEITHTVRAKMDGQSVQMAASWTPTSSSKGFSRVDLWLPQELADDVIVTIGEKKIFPLDAGENPRLFNNTDVVVFKRKSTGAVIFELSGDFVGITPPAILANRPEAGVTFRISCVTNDTQSSIGDSTQMNWGITFK